MIVSERNIILSLTDSLGGRWAPQIGMDLISEIRCKGILSFLFDDFASGLGILTGSANPIDVLVIFQPHSLHHPILHQLLRHRRRDVAHPSMEDLEGD